MGGIYATYKDKAGAARMDSWASRSACKGKADVLEDPKRVVDARKLCAHCPVIQKCALWLVAELNDRDDPGGYRAGMTEPQRKDARKEFTRALRMKAVITRTEKPCTGCGETKPLGEFPVDKRASDRRASRCLACVREAARESRCRAKRKENAA